MKKISVRFNASSQKEKADMLLYGSCDAIFPVSLIKECGDIRVLYDTAGYRSLARMRNLEASEVLSVVERVLRLSEKCEDWLFMPGEYILSPETVFVNEKTKDMKLLYIPCDSEISGENSGYTSECDPYVLPRFVRRMKQTTNESGAYYLDILMNFLLRENLRAEKIIAFIEELKQEIYECGIR